MKLHNSTAEFLVPDRVQLEKALKRTTHMSIGTHPDDLEIMAFDGILKCYKKSEDWFFGVIVTNGAGSARIGKYKDFSDLKMQAVRKMEQKKAAVIGEFGALVLLDYTSAEAKDPNNSEIIKELSNLISFSKPDILYTHNLADKHESHLGVAVKTILAIRLLDKELRPKKVYGCEVWRDLDWMLDSEKVSFDVSENPDLANDLISVYDSQISGGKRYDLAAIGRRYANATYSSAHSADQAKSIICAMDLTPLILDDHIDISSFIISHIIRFLDSVSKKIDDLL